MSTHPEDLNTAAEPADSLAPFRDSIATAIGQVSMAWIELEVALNHLMHELCGGNNTPLALVSGLLDIRDKTQIVKILAYHRYHKSMLHSISMDLFERLERLLNRIDNDLRPARNMIIHYKWVQKGFLNVTLKIMRPQSRQRGLQHNSIIPMTILDVWNVANKITLAEIGITDISNKIMPAWPEALDGISTGQLLLLVELLEQRQAAQNSAAP